MAVAEIVPPINRPIAGITARLASAAAMALMFALIKLTAARGVHIVESVFYRQLFSLPLIAAWVAMGPGFGSLRTARVPAHINRMVVGLIGMVLNFVGVIMLPLPEATVIGFTVPLFATMFAAFFLREKTGLFRWSAVIIGFAGILIAFPPNGSSMHSTGAAIALAGAVMTAVVSILIRQLGATEPAPTTVFWFSATSLVPAGIAMLFFARPHDATTWALLLAAGVSGGIGQLLLTSALRLAPVSVVLPMDYSGLIWATLLGWLIFDKLPASATLFGAPIIIASGLAILWREHHLGKIRNQMVE